MTRSALKGPDLVAQEVEAVLESAQFKKSPALSSLLTFLRDRYRLKGTEPTTEYTIAQDLLGRSEEFDPQTDPIVRVRIRRLREGLAAFYEAHERDARLTVPARSYDLEVEDLSPPVRRWSLPWKPVAAAAFVAVAIAGGLVVRGLLAPHEMEYPLVKILPMQNLTGELEFDLLEDGLRRQLGSDLQKFGRYRVFIASTTEPDIDNVDFTLRGSILAVEPEIDLTYRLERGSDSSLVYGGRLTGQVLGHNYYEAISAMSREISAQIGGQGGPLSRQQYQASTPKPSKRFAFGGVGSDVFRCIVLEELFFDSYDPVQFQEAFRCFDAVLAKIHNDPVALSSWGTLLFHAVPEFDLMRTEDLPRDMIWSADVAREAAETIAERFPNSAEAMLLLGSVQNALGQREAARISLRQAINLNPGNYTAYAVLSYLTLTEEDFDETLQLSQEAIRLSAVPQSYIYFPVFAASLVSGDKRTAISAGTAFADQRQDDAATVVRLVVARLNGDREAEARLSPIVAAMDTPFSSVGLFVRGRQLRASLRDYLPEVDFAALDI